MAKTSRINCGFLKSLSFAGFVLLTTCGSLEQGAAASDAGHHDHGYPDPDAINLLLKKVSSAHPHWMQLERVGKSYLGRDINMISMGLSPGKGYKNVIPILINSAHHGDEKITVQVVLGLIDFMKESYSHPEIQKLLKEFRFYLIPLVNPDGYAQNSRFNAQGIDINRDYQGVASPQNQKLIQPTGHNRFQSPEAQLMDRVMSRLPLAGAVALHSGAEAVYWPLGESPSPPRDHESFRKIAVGMAQTMGVRRAMQSYFDYPTQGEFIDHAYKRFGVLGLTLEVSYHHQPPQREISPIVYRSIRGLLAYAQGLATNQKGLESQPQLLHRDVAEIARPITSQD